MSKHRIWIKSILLFFVLTLGLVLPTAVKVDAFFRVYPTTKETRYVEGVKHQKIIGDIDFNGTSSKQIINYVGANIKTEDIKVVVGDGYADYGFGMSNLLSQIYNVNRRYDNLNVIAGVNGDFYNMSNGIPTMAYVRNFEVIFEGVTKARTLIGFKDDGEVVYGNPTFEGYEVMVFNEEGERKLKQIKVNGFNRLPNQGEVTVFFSEYVGVIDSGESKIVLDAKDIKSDGSGARYFGKGVLQSVTKERIEVQEKQIVLMGDSLFEEGLINETDTVVIQQKLGGKFEGVRHALGGWEHLVKQGVPETTFTAGASYQYRAPRTAIGIKSDGTIFFVTVDGRQKPQGMEGVTAYEMAEIMAYFEAEEAFNLDGGGSTTMAVLGDAEGVYDIMNSPSDGNLRSNANGFFFVKGSFDEVKQPIPFPDNRTQLELPTNLFINEEGILSFDQVENATSYELLVYGNSRIKTTSTTIDLNQLELGGHQIQLRALGNHELFRQSSYTTSRDYVVYSSDVMKMIEFLREYTRKESERMGSN